MQALGKALHLNLKSGVAAALLFLSVVPVTVVAATSDEGGVPEQSADNLFSWFRRLPIFGGGGGGETSAPQSQAVAEPDTRSGTLLPLAQPLWSELTPAQREALEPFHNEWNSWPLGEKKSWLQVADRMPQMNEDQRQKTRRRIQDWAKLSVAQRRQARLNFRMAREHPPAERAQAWQNYQNLTAEQRSKLREAGSRNATAATTAPDHSGLARQAAQPLPRTMVPSVSPSTNSGAAAPAATEAH